MADNSAPTYLQLLEEAQELGRADGRFAAAFEPPGGVIAGSPRCLGRTPAEFARFLWENRPGSPPERSRAERPALVRHRFRRGPAGGGTATVEHDPATASSVPLTGAARRAPEVTSS
jgi:hypothetical protein